MNYRTILYESQGAIAFITLNRPEVRNAQNEELKDELDLALKNAEADEGIRVIVLRGAGSCFSSGHDMKQFPRDPDSFQASDRRKWFEGDTAKVRKFVYKILRYFLNLHYLTKPTIAQVHGYCIAGGWVLASMCDIIIASEDAEFIDPVLRMGSTGVEAIVEPWDVGYRKAKELMWTGEGITAKEAWEFGMVNKVVARDELEKETMLMAQKIATTPPGTLQATKRSINRALDLMGWRQSHEQHVDVWLSNHLGDEHKTLHKDRQDLDLKDFIHKRDAGYE